MKLIINCDIFVISAQIIFTLTLFYYYCLMDILKECLNLLMQHISAKSEKCRTSQHTNSFGKVNPSKKILIDRYNSLCVGLFLCDNYLVFQ